MSKPIIFISHITEEKEIAIKLKEFIESKFLKSIEVFASSHEDSIRLGDEWIKNIKSSLMNCDVVIVLCSPVSVSRPWINFEAGGGWIREVPVIPLCHSGIFPGELPIPLKTLQGGKISDKEDIERLFSVIASINDISAPLVDDKTFFSFVEEFETKLQNSLIFKDILSVLNLLQGNLDLLKYAIISSTTPIEDINNVQKEISTFHDHKIVFKHIGNLFNPALLMMFTQEKVFQVFYRTIEKLSDDVKFLLTHKSLVLPPELIDLLNNFLFQVKNADTWMNYINIANSPNNKSLAESNKEWLLTFEEVPEYQFSNAINYFIDYYKSLDFYLNWIIQFEKLIEKLTNKNALQQNV